MIRPLPIAVALLVTTAPMAGASGYINIAWVDCAPGGGLLDDNFACNTNTGFHQLVASFQPTMTLGQFNGHRGVVAIQVANPVMPPWWALQVGGCRNPTPDPSDDRLTVNYDFTGMHGCADPWHGGGASGGLDITFIPPNRLRLDTACALAAPESLYLEDADGNQLEYYLFKCNLSNRQTVGDGACSGCTYPACIAINSLTLTQAAGADDVVITASQQPYVTWKHGAFGLPCPVTPTRQATWGMVKTLYR